VAFVAGLEAASVKPPKFNLSATLPAFTARHGQSQPRPANFAVLLKMRGATQVHLNHVGRAYRADVSHFRVQVWQSDMDLGEGLALQLVRRETGKE
jgi:hypothetical protein